MNKVEIEGVNLEYRWYGEAADKKLTIVMLHEGLGCVGLWKHFPEQLAQQTGCRVLSYSRQGYGNSDPVKLPRSLKYMHHEGIYVLPLLLDAFSIDKVVLFGHSDGASIALIFAGSRQDERLLGLILLAPHVFNEEKCVESIALARQFYKTGQLREQLMKYHGSNVDGAFWGWNKAWLDPGFWFWNLEEYLATINVPLLIIQGEDDEYGTSAQVEAIRDQVSTQTTVELLLGCKHSPHRDQPQAVLELSEQFVQQLPV
jgi:pimeloyl-ACP methyl ester carboxylesterase